MRAQERETVEQDVDAYRLLIEQVIAGGGLAGVARALADMLGLPAVVADDTLEVLHAFAPRGRHLPAAEASLPAASRTSVRFDISSERRASTDPPTLRVDTNGSEIVVSPIVLPSGIIGYVWASDPSGHVAPRADRVVSHAAAACALEMMRQSAMMEGESRVRNSFLEDLLTGTIASLSATRRRAQFLGYDLRKEHAVFMLDIDYFSDFIERHGHDESDIQKLKDRFRRSVDACIPGVWDRALVWEHSDAMVVLAGTSGAHGLPAFRTRVETLRAAVERRLNGPTVSAGIGRPYVDLHKLKASYSESEHAVRIGLATTGPSSTTAFDDLGAYRLLFLLRGQSELRAFYEETIGPLQRYDEEHDAHLVDTLDRYLAFQGNLSETARELHLHRNGLLYRLSRIETILDIDLATSTQRLALQLALLSRPLLDTRPRSATRVPHHEREEDYGTENRRTARGVSRTPRGTQ